MNNLILHLLSNRTGPFIIPEFGTDKRFLPARFSSDMERLRSLLFLDVENNDYYLKTYLVTLECYPEIKALFPASNESFKPWDVPPRGVQIFGGEFMSAVSAGLFLDPTPTGLPLNFTYDITYKNAGLVDVSALEVGQHAVTGYSLNGDVLRINWPEGFPFDGAIRLNQVWNDGATIRIIVEPSHFPFAALVQRVRNNNLFQRLLAKRRLVDEFVGSPEAEEQTAIILAVVGLEHPLLNT